MHDIVIKNGLVMVRVEKRSTSMLPSMMVTPLERLGEGIVSRCSRQGGDARLLTFTRTMTQVTWDDTLMPSSWHGCTTVVMGSVGSALPGSAR